MIRDVVRYLPKELPTNQTLAACKCNSAVTKSASEPTPPTWQILPPMMPLRLTQIRTELRLTMRLVCCEYAEVACASLQCIVPSHVHASGSNAQASTPADLPLRQSLKKSQAAYEPKIHDITEKFTKASSCMYYPFAPQHMS